MFFKEQINPKNLRITLETLINIRWIAIIGQFFTVSFVYYGLKFQFPYFVTLALIFVSADLNSIRVPPLKSIPKFKPLNVSNNRETITKDTERILNLL